MIPKTIQSVITACSSNSLKNFTVQRAAVLFITSGLLFHLSIPHQGKYWRPIEMRSEYEVAHNSSSQPHESPIKVLRLNSTVKRILYWTTRYKHKTNYNEKLICGRNGEYKCHLTSDSSLFESSHALLFHGWKEDMLSKERDTNGIKTFIPIGLPPVRFPDQYYVFNMMEPPSNFGKPMRCYELDFFNWTITYRTDSEGYVPYGRFHVVKALKRPINLAAQLKKKTKLILWVLSNSFNVSSRRLDLVNALRKHVPVDIYGKYGNLTCPKNCKKVLGRQYKFYLALENNVCQDYVTEKAFLAYDAGMVPIVYGAANYNLFLPHGSYINMNTFPTAKALADYLLYLDQHPEEYAMYFEWRRYYRLQTGLDWKSGYCGICERLHLDYPAGRQKIIPNITEWLYEPENKYRACAPPMKW